jgi:hypothetical protein
MCAYILCWFGRERAMIKTDRDEYNAIVFQKFRTAGSGGRLLPNSLSIGLFDFRALSRPWLCRFDI